MTVRCRAGGVTRCPVTVLRPHMPQPERQATWQASRGIAPLIVTHLRLPLLATGLPPLVHPTRGVPPLTVLPLPAGGVRQAGGCVQPVLLRGRVDHVDGAPRELLHRYSTGHEPREEPRVACKTRRASRCPPRAGVYRGDTSP